MFIQTEVTPNPATLKFLPGRPVMEEGTFEARDATEADRSPLAKALMQLPGVGGVFFANRTSSPSPRRRASGSICVRRCWVSSPNSICPARP